MVQLATDLVHWPIPHDDKSVGLVGCARECRQCSYGVPLSDEMRAVELYVSWLEHTRCGVETPPRCVHLVQPLSAYDPEVISSVVGQKPLSGAPEVPMIHVYREVTWIGIPMLL